MVFNKLYTGILHSLKKFDKITKFSLNSELLVSFEKRNKELDLLILYLSNILRNEEKLNIMNKDIKNKNEIENEIENEKKNYVKILKQYLKEILSLYKTIEGSKNLVLSNIDGDKFSSEDEKAYKDLLLNVKECIIKDIDYSVNQLNKLKEIKLTINNKIIPFFKKYF